VITFTFRPLYCEERTLAINKGEKCVEFIKRKQGEPYEINPNPYREFNARNSKCRSYQSRYKNQGR